MKLKQPYFEFLISKLQSLINIIPFQVSQPVLRASEIELKLSNWIRLNSDLDNAFRFQFSVLSILKLIDKMPTRNQNNTITYLNESL